MHNGTHDGKLPVDKLPIIADDAPGEGLYAFIQATTCCQEVLVRVFHNAKPSESLLQTLMLWSHICLYRRTSF